MSKFHITGRGEPGPCRATTGACPLGGEGDHYSTPQEAAAAYEEANKGQVLTSVSKDTYQDPHAEQDRKWSEWAAKESGGKTYAELGEDHPITIARFGVQANSARLRHSLALQRWSRCRRRTLMLPPAWAVENR